MGRSAGAAEPLRQQVLDFAVLRYSAKGAPSNARARRVPRRSGNGDDRRYLRCDSAVTLSPSFCCKAQGSSYRLRATHSRSDNPARPVPSRNAGPPGLTLRRSRISFSCVVCLANGGGPPSSSSVRIPANHRLLRCTRCLLGLGFGFGLRSVIPTQVVNPSVSRATVPQGTALTVRVEPSGATVFNPGPSLGCGNGPVEYGVGGAPVGVYAPV